MDPFPRYIGKYQIVGVLGHGGMGSVYKAYHPQLQRYVAIKVVAPSSESDPGFLARFGNEARAVASLRHPHIVQVFDFDIEDDRPYMVMEYIQGETLAQRIVRYRRSGQLLPIPGVVRLFGQICSAVDYAHQRGMLHRDLKPANVIINQQNDAILTDFGIAKITGVSAATTTGMFLGTPHYMSPEQAQGLPIDGRSDVYALSVMLYLLLAGRLPFQADNPGGLVLQHLLAEPEPIERINPLIPRRLSEVVLIGLAKQPEERFRTAGALGRAAAAAAINVPVKRIVLEPGSVDSSLGPPNPMDLMPTHLAERPDFSTLLMSPPGTGSRPPAEASNSTRPLAEADASTRLRPEADASTHLLPPSGSRARTTDRAETPTPREPTPRPSASQERRPPRKKQHTRLIASGILVTLLLVSSGILALALSNRGQTEAVTAPLVGMVLFTSSNPLDFSHPANLLNGSFHGLKAPPQGSGDFAWLCDSGAAGCTLLGPLSVEQDGTATFSFTQSGSLLGGQDVTKQSTTLTFEISQERGTGTPTAPTTLVYLGKIPANALVHIRHELGAFGKEGLFANNTTALMIGLGNDALLLQTLSKQMQQAQAANNLREMQVTAEYLLNLLSGATGAQDWNHDGRTGFFQGDDTFGLGTTAQVNTSSCDGPQDTYLPLVMHHACNTYLLGTHTPTIQHLFQQVQQAGANIVGWVGEISQIAQKIAGASQAGQVTLGDVNTLADRADDILNGSSISDTQTLDGARQILGFIEQMATISVSAA